MPSRRPHEPAPSHLGPTRSAVIEALQQPPMASQFSATAMALVMAIRLMACCSAARMDPLVQLSRQLHSLTAAKAVLDFAQACARAWPENAMVSRPCCHALTPDEAVFAQMAEAAASGDSADFSAILNGLVRRERHERLHDLTRETVAVLSNHF